MLVVAAGDEFYAYPDTSPLESALPLLSGGDGSADPRSVAVDGAYPAVQDALSYEFGVFRGRAAVVGRPWRSDGGADRIWDVSKRIPVELVESGRKAFISFSRSCVGMRLMLCITKIRAAPKGVYEP